MFASLFVCLLATLRKNVQTDLHEIFREGWQLANEQMIKFWWPSRSDSPDGGTDIATLVRHALTEVCTVPLLLVLFVRPKNRTFAHGQQYDITSVKKFGN